MKKLNTMLHNVKVQETIILVSIFAIVAVVFMLTLGK